MSPHPLLILKVGDAEASVRARHGDFEDYFRRGLALEGDPPLVVVDPRAGAAPPDPGDLAGVVVTGSGSMVTDDEPWSVATERWLADAVTAELPVLGVCYGHQLLARALGGEVAWNPRGREIGTVDVELAPAAARDALLRGLESPLAVQATHSQSVTRLPAGAEPLAGNAHDPHQAFRAGARAWGVQFHPEFTAEVVRGYLEARREACAAEGIDVDALLATVAETTGAARILRRFGALLRGRPVSAR